MLFWLGPPTLAASQAQREKNQFTWNDAPLHVASDRMVVKQRERIIEFEGHVVIKQKDMTITAKKMTIFGGSPGKDGEQGIMNRIDRIQVEGDVVISQGTKVAKSERAIYYRKAGKIVLLGHPMLQQGQDHITGQVITLHLDEMRTVVEGSPDRPVQGIFHPRERQ